MVVVTSLLLFLLLGANSGEVAAPGARRLSATAQHVLMGRQPTGALGLLRLRGGLIDDNQPFPLEDEDFESSMMFLSNAELESLDPDASEVKAVQFTPAAQARIDQALREFREYTEQVEEPEAGVDDVELRDEPDEEFRHDISTRFDALLRSHPDRSSKVPGRGSYRVTAPCASVGGSLWDYLDAVGDDVDSGNSSEFDAYLDDAKAAFNRSDVGEETFNPGEEVDEDMARDPGAEFAYSHMFAQNDWETRYKTWRAIMVDSRRQRRKEGLRQGEGTGTTENRTGASSCRELLPERQYPDREVMGDELKQPGLREDPFGDDGGENADDEDEGDLEKSDEKPMNPTAADATMRRNFARPFQFPGRIQPLTHDGDYSTPDSSASGATLDAGRAAADESSSSSVSSWQGLNADDDFVFEPEELVHEARRLQINFTVQEQWEKDVYLRELCCYMPDDVILPEDHARRLRMAVQFGAQYNRSDWWGWYPLHHAAFAGLSSVCRELVKMGADVDCVNRDGSTPVMLAARHGRLATTKMLLDLGADFRITSKDGETILDKAIRSEHRKLAVTIFDLLDKSRDNFLSDGRPVSAGIQVALASAPSNAPTNMHLPASFDEWMRTRNATGSVQDPRNLWRPKGWTYRDIDRHKKTAAVAPEVQAYKEQQEWNELVGSNDE